MTINITIRPTANAKLPLAICASFGRNGAPAAAPNKSSPTPNGSSSCNSLASAMAASGINTKFASSDKTSSRTLRSGAMICPTVSPNPIANMLDTTNASITMGTNFWSISIICSVKNRSSIACRPARRCRPVDFRALWRFVCRPIRPSGATDSSFAEKLANCIRTAGGMQGAPCELEHTAGVEPAYPDFADPRLADRPRARGKT